MQINPEYSPSSAVVVYEITLTKTADLGTIASHKIFEGYTVKGIAKALPVVGESFVFARTERNGVEVFGVFGTSPVLAVCRGDEANSLIIETANSVYSLHYRPYSLDASGASVLE